MSHANVEDIRKRVRIYIGVFVALAVLTVVTVGVAQIHMSIGAAIAVAMIVALVKGTLVAGYFMHLFDERKVIYVTLALCVVLFAVLMLLPVVTTHENRVIDEPHATAAPHASGPGPAGAGQAAGSEHGTDKGHE